MGESGVPLVRMMAWFKDPNLRIVGMAFNHSAQWLVCVTTDMSIFVLSIYFMMVRGSLVQPMKAIQTTRYSREKKFHFSDVKCWRSGAGIEYAIITTTPGNVRLINLSNGEYFKVKAKTSLAKFHILTEPGGAQSRPSTWLLIESPGHGFYRLLIGHYLDSGKYEDIAAAGAIQKPEFAFYAVSISKTPNPLLSVQQSLRGPVVLIYEPDARVLQLLDSNLRLLFKYNVNTNAEVKSVHVTENLIFVLTNPPNDTTAPVTKLLVFSRILSEEKRPFAAPYQEFALPTFERIRGPFFPGFVRPFVNNALSPDSSSSEVAPSSLGRRDSAPSLMVDKTKTSKYRPKSVRSYVEVNPMALKAALQGDFGDESPSPSMQHAAGGLFSFAHRTGTSVTSPGLGGVSSATSSSSASPLAANGASAPARKALVEFLDERGELAYEESWIDESQTEGVYFWTDDSLYQLRASHSPEELFFRLMEKKQGEALGLTFALDMCKLYELAADERFRRGQLGEAASLYHLSNVSTPKLIRQWLSVGRMDEPISTLRVLLMSGKVGEARRPRVAHELIRCHVQRLLNPSKHSNLLKLLNVNERCRDEELENFLKNNPDFDETETRNFFATLGLLRFDLIVAQSKRHLKPALDALSARRGISYLSMEHLRFVSENNAMETGTLKVEDANTLISHFPPHIQLLHYLTAVSNIQNTLPRINDLLAELDDESLAKVCRFFDPQGPFLGPMIHSQDHVHLQQLRTQSPQRRSRTGGAQDPAENVEGHSASGPASASSSGAKSGAYLDSRHFVSQCVELFLSALIRLNRASNALPQSWNVSEPVAATVTTRQSRSGSIEERASMKSSSDSVGGRSGSLGSLSASSESHGVPVSHALPVNGLSGVHRSASTEGVLSPRRGRPDASASSQAQGRGLKLRRAVDVHCGFHHTALLTETGQVFTWGAGSKGQLGHENVSDSLWVPRLVFGLSGNSLSSGDRVTKVACGANHTLAFTASGLLFAFGSNARGQLGLGDRDDRFEPRQVILGEQIRLEMATSTQMSSSLGNQTQSPYTTTTTTTTTTTSPSSSSPVGTLVDISAGFWHSVIVTDRGVWIAGANSAQDANAAGLHSDTGDLLSFAPVPNIPLDESYVMARCGFAHTALLTKRGRVYTFGSNEHGQLGIGDYAGDSVAWNANPSIESTSSASGNGIAFSASPVHVRGLLADKHVIHIACGSFSTFAVSEVYSVYAWGQNSKGRLGIIPGSSRRKPSSGNYGDAFASGSGSHDSGSDAEARDEKLPVRIDALQGLEISRVYAGPSHAFATSSNGKVYVWGDCNTTMKAKAADPRLPALVNRWTDSRISSVGCGDDFSVTVLENGLVYTFGRGVCGQLGHNDEHDNWEARQAFLNTSLGLDAGSDVHAFATGPHPSQSLPDHGGMDSLSSSFNSDHGLSSSMLSNGSSNVTSPTIQQVASRSNRNQSPMISSSTDILGLSSISEEEEAHDATLGQSTILNAASAVSTYSDPSLLDECLRVLKKRFRPSIILQHAYVADNLAAAAVILEQCNAWEAAIDCKIRLLQRELPKMGHSLSQQTHLMTEMLKDLALPEVSSQARLSGLKNVLSLWHEFGASIAMLESILISSIAMTVATASLLKSEDIAQSGLAFTPRFMLTIVKARLDTQNRDRAHSSTEVLGPGTPIRKPSTLASQPGSSSSGTGGLLARDPVWSERKATLEKELKVRTKIQISQPALEDFIHHNISGASSGRTGSQPGGANYQPTMPLSENPNATGDLVFTCGHMYSHRRFTQSTLQLFRDKMARFPVPLPLTVKLLIMDYSSGACNSACPACVYNHLREKHAPSLERWNPQ